MISDDLFFCAFSLACIIPCLRSGCFRAPAWEAGAFCYICPFGHIYAFASAEHSSKLDALLSAFCYIYASHIYTPSLRQSIQTGLMLCSQLFAIFMLRIYIRQCFGIVKINFASALSFLLYLSFRTYIRLRLGRAYKQA